MTASDPSPLVAVLVIVGAFFLAVGTVGLLRLPNVYNRMHATSKPTTLGTVSIFLAGFVHFGPGGAGLTSLVGILFLFLTVPTGAHMISRAAQKTGVPFLGSVTWPTSDESVLTEGGSAPDERESEEESDSSEDGADVDSTDTENDDSENGADVDSTDTENDDSEDGADADSTDTEDDTADTT